MKPTNHRQETDSALDQKTAGNGESRPDIQGYAMLDGKGPFPIHSSSESVRPTGEVAPHEGLPTNILARIKELNERFTRMEADAILQGMREMLNAVEQKYKKDLLELGQKFFYHSDIDGVDLPLADLTEYNEFVDSKLKELATLREALR